MHWMCTEPASSALDGTPPGVGGPVRWDQGGLQPRTHRGSWGPSGGMEQFGSAPQPGRPWTQDDETIAGQAGPVARARGALPHLTDCADLGGVVSCLTKDMSTANES